MRSPDVLITAASRRVPLVAAFRRAIAGAGGRVIVTDINPLSPAVYAADRAYRVPIAADPGYAGEILAISLAERVHLVVPTIDDELPILAAAAPTFARYGIVVAVSPVETTLTCNDKFETCRVLRAAGVEAAESFLAPALPPAPPFPLFVKPRYGRGGVGAYPIRNERELAFFLEYVADPVVQPYLDGPEFTLDVMCDRAGHPVSIVPRERVVIRSGVMDRGRTVNDPRMFDLAAACAGALRFFGPINIQCRMVHGRPVVFEINPRFSGGIPLTIAAGADFPRLLLDISSGRPVASAIGRFSAGLWMTSYESGVFLDDADVRLERLRQPAAREVA
ncbi:MAG: ATP-grasp domain-containing protein [Acidobacteria bacterium]|nr:ATP-grasp domain-containing protein [Acidobacteriota bacterium]